MSLRSRATMQFSVSVPPRLVEHPLPVVLGIPVQDTGYFRVEPSYMIRYITWHCCGPPGQYPRLRISAWYFRVASLTRLPGPYQSMTAPSMPRRTKSARWASTVAVLSDVYWVSTLLLHRGTLDELVLSTGVQKPSIMFTNTFVVLPGYSRSRTLSVDTLPAGGSNNGVSIPVRLSVWPVNVAAQSAGDVGLPTTQPEVLF